MEYTYEPKGVCTRIIHMEIDGGVIRSVRFEGGCAGNTQGISALVRNREAREVIEQLRGIRCGVRPTSCPDQLSIALEEALDKERAATCPER